MKRTIIFLLVILTGWNCDSQPSNIYIKNKEQYDQSFIDGLSSYKKPLKLVDNYINADGFTTYFPEALKINREVLFKSKKDNQLFELKVTRINLTSLNYSFHLTNPNNNNSISRTGKAILGSMFFLGSEIDIDDITGQDYSSYEYWDKTNDSSFSIRVGTGKDKNGKLRAKITLWSNSQGVGRIDLKECPTMYTE